jgi:L-ascorbate peroxidase
LIQLAGCIAIEVCGGPSLQEKMRFGRVDAPYYYQQTEKEIDKEHAKDTKSMPISSSNNKKCPCYPSALPPYPDAAPTAEIHLRNVFYRLGCSNKDIVALMGAHTIGRAFANRSGVCSNTSGDRGATKYTCQTWDARVG